MKTIYIVIFIHNKDIYINLFYVNQRLRIYDFAFYRKSSFQNQFFSFLNPQPFFFLTFFSALNDLIGFWYFYNKLLQIITSEMILPHGKMIKVTHIGTHFSI